ncbi:MULTISPECIES: hypothetical protein [unclassified Clostridium]|uniref:hypothetical protein n=1 Tax=unclassified Clostridium TaxID=2614128 RepID=UPI0025BA3AB4|nr:hypothetical protein [Clostridium sp.]MCI6692658.1 hypothetical protein [Clostridium sp.]MDY2631223.1 hypothetical protein [Clostridium sp.]MDY4253088.1 hypothetical protein [Clostridium sp.]MDY6226560.1 hypothetical protein [Clostridium sp.]
MSINFKKFVPRPGLVNKQGRLPDPSELVCIEVPKVFDQCLIKRCLVYADGLDSLTTDEELRSNPLVNPKRYLSSRDFRVRLLSVDKIPLKGDPNFKKLVLNYVISFYSDYIDNSGINQSEFYEIHRTDIVGRFYCPDSIAQISASSDEDVTCEESNIIKLEMVAEALDGQIIEDEAGDEVLDITLGYFIVVKCQLLVQLLIPAYDYCPVPREACEEEPEEDPCERFERSPIPKFYPDQNLEPLFQECDDEDR